MLVLPLPKKPVMTVTGIFVAMFCVWF